MTKSFFGLVMVLLIITFCNSCTNNNSAERTGEGVVLATVEQEFNGIQGKLVQWAEAPRTMRGGDIFEEGEGMHHKKWFVYPATKFMVEPAHKIRLTYKVTAFIEKSDIFVPVIYVIAVENLGPLKPKF